jgi:hypothetical protein
MKERETERERKKKREREIEKERERERTRERETMVRMESQVICIWQFGSVDIQSHIIKSRTNNDFRDAKKAKNLLFVYRP